MAAPSDRRLCILTAIVNMDLGWPVPERLHSGFNEDKGDAVVCVMTTGAISRAKLQSNRHYQQINSQFFTGLMPFPLPNQQCQSTEEKSISTL